jgi:hypothetical protein
LLAIVVLGLVNTSSVTSWWLLAMGGSLTAEVAAGWAALRARRAVRTAERSLEAPAVPARMPPVVRWGGHLLWPAGPSRRVEAATSPH